VKKSLLVKIGTDTFDVYLCPKIFLDDMGVNFSQGEEIVLTGSRLSREKLNSFLLGFDCREEVWVGWGFSEVQAAFVATLATMYGNMMRGIATR